MAMLVEGCSGAGTRESVGVRLKGWQRRRRRTPIGIKREKDIRDLSDVATLGGVFRLYGRNTVKPMEPVSCCREVT